MGKEIERKFLVKSDAWRILAPGILYRQGYLSADTKRAVRIRTIENKAYLTMKGKTEKLLTRLEYEYEIPFSDGVEMLDKLCQRPLIEKNRHKIPFKGFIWEVDEFFGENAGLIVAEVELSHEDEQVSLPEWVGKEVTEDPRYLNANLIKNPYKNWKANG